MNVQTLVVLFALGAAALALWTDARFSKLAPEAARAVLLHVAVALVLSRLMIVAVERVSEDGSPVRVLAAVFGLALPSLVYVLLAGVWVIKFAQRRLYRGSY
jgi:hypothetical protein